MKNITTPIKSTGRSNKLMMSNTRRPGRQVAKIVLHDEDGDVDNVDSEDIDESQALDQSENPDLRHDTLEDERQIRIGDQNVKNHSRRSKISSKN